MRTLLTLMALSLVSGASIETARRARAAANEQSPAAEASAQKSKEAAPDPSAPSAPAEDSDAAQQPDSADSAAGSEAVAAASNPLAELVALGQGVASRREESGGSIRAKRGVQLAATEKRRAPQTLHARVEVVARKAFPLVALRLRVRRPARRGPGKALDRGERLVVVPALSFEDGVADLSDPTTLRNAGAFYLQKGDRVLVQLDERQGDVWKAGYLQRR